VLEALQALDIQKPVLTLGIADVFTEHGDPVKLLAELGLDATGIRASITQRFSHLLA
jgi:1-deoxy-D-xylulose-5-phosphate synthase